MNVANMHILKDRILAEPEHYEQNVYGEPFNMLGIYLGLVDPLVHALLETRREFERERQTGSSIFCGTACCMAGTAFAIVRPEVFQARAKKNELGEIDAGTITEVARDWLELTPFQADTLFASSRDWPSPFKEQYLAADNLVARSQVGAAMIDHMIENAEAYEFEPVAVDDDDDDDGVGDIDYDTEDDDYLLDGFGCGDDDDDDDDDEDEED